MDYKYIEQLLDRYFRAETTLQEEQILKAFFAQGAEDMPQELQQYAPLFAAFDEQPELGDDFDERVLAQLPADIVPLQPKQVKARTIRLTERLRPLFGAAAMVAILLTVGNAINQSMRHDTTWMDADEYANIKVESLEPSVAYDQVTDTLTLAKDEIPMPVPSDSLLNGGID
ncbi:MAG: hypothetical protein J6V97_06460 [Prevotella sp.]|nr:hypothetical protein [Prevotella sp.]